MERHPAFGDSAEHAWVVEFLDRCFPESGGRVNADLQMAGAMCRAEPKSAQAAMQLLAQDLRLRDDLGPEQREFLRFALGVLFTCYAGVAAAEGRCRPGALPPELEGHVRWNPEIIECANALGPLKFA